MGFKGEPGAGWNPPFFVPLAAAGVYQQTLLLFLVQMVEEERRGLLG